MILGFNTEREVFYKEEFEKLGAEVLVATADGSMGQKGFAAMGFILGTALAVCVIFLKFTFDDRPRKPQDIEVSAGIPTLAIVPKSKV